MRKGNLTDNIYNMIYKVFLPVNNLYGRSAWVIRNEHDEMISECCRKYPIIDMYSILKCNLLPLSTSC